MPVRENRPLREERRRREMHSDWKGNAFEAAQFQDGTKIIRSRITDSEEGQRHTSQPHPSARQLERPEKQNRLLAVRNTCRRD